MIIFLKQKYTGEYYTIYRRDLEEFMNLKKFFDSDINFDIIQEYDEIKNILDTKFTSSGRGEEYNENLPSSSQVSSKLFPLNVRSDKFLLKWLNNQTEGDIDKLKTQNVLSRGTWVHKIIELFVTDKEGRLNDRPIVEKLKKLKGKKGYNRTLKQLDKKILFDIRKYMQIAYNDKEIQRKIYNLEDLKEELEHLSTFVLPNFIKEKLVFTDLVYSEIFISVPDYIQGSIDLVCYKDNKFSIVDFKTTSSVDKSTGKPKFKSTNQLAPYARQLAIYYTLLNKSNMNHIFDDSVPKFYIYQLHLVSGKYKEFEIPFKQIEVSIKAVNKVLDWYWDIRNGKFDKYKESKSEYIEDELNLGVLTL